MTQYDLAHPNARSSIVAAVTRWLTTRKGTVYLRLSDSTLHIGPPPKTHEQLGYYWSTVLPYIAAHCGMGRSKDDLEALHRHLGREFWPDHTRHSINPVTGEVCAEPMRTSRMNVHEFSRLVLDPVLAWAADQGIYIPEPKPNRQPV